MVSNETKLNTPWEQAGENYRIALGRRDPKVNIGFLKNIAERITRLFLCIMECIPVFNRIISALDQKYIFPKHTVEKKTLPTPKTPSTVSTPSPAPTATPIVKTANVKEEDGSKALPTEAPASPITVVEPAIIVSPKIDSPDLKKPSTVNNHSLLKIAGISSLAIASIGLIYWLVGTQSIAQTSVEILPLENAGSPINLAKEAAKTVTSEIAKVLAEAHVPNLSETYQKADQSTLNLFVEHAKLSMSTANSYFWSFTNAINSTHLLISSVATTACAGLFFGTRKCKSKDKTPDLTILTPNTPKSTEKNENSELEAAQQLPEEEHIPEHQEPSRHEQPSLDAESKDSQPSGEQFDLRRTTETEIHSPKSRLASVKVLSGSTQTAPDPTTVSQLGLDSSVAKNVDSALDNGSSDYQEGVLLEGKGQYAQAFLSYKKAAEKENHNAMTRLFFIFNDDEWNKFDPAIQERVVKEGRIYLVDEAVKWGEKALVELRKQKSDYVVKAFEIPFSILKFCQLAIHKEQELIPYDAPDELSEWKSIFYDCARTGGASLHAIHYIVSCSLEEKRFARTFDMITEDNETKDEYAKNWSERGLRLAKKEKKADYIAFFEESLAIAEKNIMAEQEKEAKAKAEKEAAAKEASANRGDRNELEGSITNLQREAEGKNDPYGAAQIGQLHYMCYEKFFHGKKLARMQKIVGRGRLTFAVEWIGKAVDGLTAVVQEEKQKETPNLVQIAKHEKALTDFEQLQTTYKAVQKRIYEDTL